MGFTEDQVYTNTIAADTVVGILNAYTGLPEYLEILTPTPEWVVVSRVQNGVTLTVAQATPITAVVVVDDTVDSMSRRLPGRGE